MRLGRGLSAIALLLLSGCNDDDLVEGDGAVPVYPTIEVTPDLLQYRTPVGLQESSDVTVRNAGAQPLEVSQLRVDPPSWVWDLTAPSSSSPWTLAPGESMTVTIQFGPLNAGTATGTLTVRSNDPERPQVIVPLDGWGQPVHVESTTQSGQYHPADILLVIDNSGSMSDEQTKLQNAMSGFISWVSAQSVDFHLGVVTTDDAMLQGTTRWVESSTPNLEATFMANSSVNTWGSGTEEGLRYALSAVSAPLVTGYNAGFLRPEAVLHVVCISDEDEQSAPSAASYRASFEAVKGDPSLVFHTAIAEPSSKYQELTTLTGGYFGSIYDNDYSPVLQSLALEITSYATDFPLAYPADPTTLVVRVNGIEQPEGLVWTYVTASNLIRFVSNVPAIGDLVEITYAEP